MKPGRLLFLILAVGIGLVGYGCGKSNPARMSQPLYYFQVVKPGWDTVIYINGNPAFRGGAALSAFKDVSPWLKEGTNPVRIVTRRVPDSFYPGDACDIRFIRVDPKKPEEPEVLNGIDASPAEADRYEVEFPAVSRNKLRWLWQDADEIQDLSDADRESIYDKIRNLAAALRRKDEDAVKNHMTQVWGDGPVPEGLLPLAMNREKIEKLDREILQKVFAYDDYTVTLSDPKNLEFLKGSRAVLVSRKPVSHPAVRNDVVHAGHGPGFKAGPGLQNWSISRPVLHFLRIDGKWKMLAP